MQTNVWAGLLTSRETSLFRGIPKGVPAHSKYIWQCQYVAAIQFQTYLPNVTKIPAASISIEDADMLNRIQLRGKLLKTITHSSDNVGVYIYILDYLFTIYIFLRHSIMSTCLQNNSLGP